MRFGEPLALFALALGPLVLVLHLWLERRRTRRLQDAGDPELIDGLVLSRADGGRGLRAARAILLSLSVVLIALALARPQFGMRTELRRGRGIDLAIALDLSKSMLARDVVPSRLERARIELGELIDQLKGDRIGLVGFTSVALPLCPLTVDHAALKLQLKAAAPGDLPRGGTAIADAIDAGKRMLETSRASSAAKALLIVTDGEENEGDPALAAKKAHETGIEVHVVGVGSRTGEPIPVVTADGRIDGYLKDGSGQTVVSRLNENMLRQIAEAGGGTVALPSESGGIDLSSVRAHLGTLKKSEMETRVARVYEERYQWPLAPAIVLLLVATVLRPSRPRARVRSLGSRLGGTALAAFLILLAVTGFERPLSAGPLEREDPDTKAGNEHLAGGRTKEAVESYTRALERLGDDPRILFNRGLAQASAGELDAAITDLKLASESADRPETRAEAAYALGNAYRKLRKWDQAIEAYKRSLLEDPRRTESRRNLEIAQRMKAIEAMQPRDPNQENEGDAPPPPSQDGGASPDSGERDGGQPPDAENGDGESGDGASGESPDATRGDSGSGAEGASDGSAADGAHDGGGNRSSAPETADAGMNSDAGTPESAESAPARESPDESRAQDAVEILDALQEQEKALKRKRLLEKFRAKTVEKDW